MNGCSAVPRRRPTLGARPLRRDIQRYIVDELWELMICHKDHLPDRIGFTMNGEEVLFMPRAHALLRNRRSATNRASGKCQQLSVTSMLKLHRVGFV